jgi:hypothetical protein
MTLIDDASRPTLRERIGRLLSTCASAEIAVGHIRLAALDLTEHETRGVKRCRILLGRLDARALTDFGFADAGVDDRMRALLAFLESGRIEIRSAGLGAWSPDFSVYRGLRDGGRAGRGLTDGDRADRGLTDGYRADRAPAERDRDDINASDGGSACLVGAHYFREPPSPNGPSFTALITDTHSVALALARFEALWERSHDVLEPVASAVHRRQSFSGA